jgi:hypothetical protein
MKRNINTNLNYRGSVNVSLNINGNKVIINKHNNGLPDLFRLISKALAGYNTSTEKISYIDLRYNTIDSPDDFVSCLTAKQSITQLTYSLNSGSWVTNAASTIPYASLIVAPISYLNAKEFRIYLMTKDVDVAYISVDEQDLLKLVPGTQALVEWTLKISNS